MRNKNIDAIRMCATIIIIIFHSWAIMGAESFGVDDLTLVFSLLGEIGVTCFFVLSGYGIFFSLNRSFVESGKIDIRLFYKKRLVRILPAYYGSILVLLLIGNGSYYLSRDGVKSILTHVLFIHNLFPQEHGSLNGILWTMGVIVQFYIIAPLLYKLLKRIKFLFPILFIIITILLKTIVYYWLIPYYNIQGLNFFLGRQLVTSIDNFAIGMFVAWLITERKLKISNFKSKIGVICSIFGVYVVCKLGQCVGVHSISLGGVMWHSILAMDLGVLLLCVSYLPAENCIVRTLSRLSIYEYEIYIWHYIIISNLFNSSELVQGVYLFQYGKIALYVLFLLVTIFFGILYGECVQLFSFKKILNKNEVLRS